MTRTLVTLTVAALFTADGTGADTPAPPEIVAGVIASVQPKVDQLVVTVAEGDARTVRVVGPTVRFASRPAALADLRPGMGVELVYRGNSAELLEVRATWPRQVVVVKAVDPAAKTLRVEAGASDLTLRLDPGAKVVVDELPAGVADVPVGMKVRVELSADKTGALAVEADGAPDTLPGLVKRYDAATSTLLVEVRAAGFRYDRVTTLGFPVAAGAKVRHAGRDVALADLKERMPVRLTFTPDRRTVAAILTGDPLPPEVNDDD